MSDLMDLCNADSNENYPKWGVIDAAWWQTFGGDDYLNKYKDSYLIYHRTSIKKIASQYKIPADLLGSVARIEAGGKPDGVKQYVVLPIRQLDYSGPDWIDKHLTMTNPPENTSIGIVAIQIRIISEMFGKNPEKLSINDVNYISNCLQKDIFNLNVVAKHLHDLIVYDFPDIDTTNLTDEQFIIAGSRYNRGKERNLNDFKQSINADTSDYSSRVYTSYGRTMLRNRNKVKALLEIK